MVYTSGQIQHPQTPKHTEMHIYIYIYICIRSYVVEDTSGSSNDRACTTSPTKFSSIILLRAGRSSLATYIYIYVCVYVDVYKWEV